jgi:hypothetical protein
LVFIDLRTIFREKASRKTARYRKPNQVGM